LDTVSVLGQTSRFGSVIAAFLIAGCTNGSSSSYSLPPNAGSDAAHPSPKSLPSQALIAFDTANGSLGYWPIKKGGGKTLQPLTGPLGVDGGYAMAANGDTVIIANYSPAEIVTYDIDTQAESTMHDPYGNPLDVAVDTQGDIYAMNTASVAVYKVGSSQPSKLSCSYMSISEAIAVDNEGDVFVDGYGSSFQGVVEYASGSSSCKIPHLRKSLGYVAGVGVDPKTDDLIVVDDPDLCAGGLEGRMIIYPKPYEQRTSRRHVLSATYCAGIFRLDASSTHIFYADATVSDAFPLIDQARYPSGTYEGQYENGYYSGGNFSGFTTIPNTLPN
jgi:hypothetical protein